MPRAGDAFLAGQLPRSHDPMVRINSNPPALEITLQDLIDSARQWFTEIGLPILEELTGLPFTALEPLLGDFTTVDEFVSNVLLATGRFAGLNEVINWLRSLVLGEPPLADPGFPYAFPVTWSWEIPANPVDVFFANLRSFLTYDFTNPSFDLAAAATEFIETILNPVNAIVDAFGRDTLNEIRDAITNILDGIPFVGGSLADAWVALTDFYDDHQATTATAENAAADADAAQASADNAQYSTETLQGFFNEPRVLPAYVGGLSDSVAFDRDSVDGTTTPTLGTIVLIPVKITQDRIIDAIKFGCAATTMTNLYVGLYDADETTGDLSKVLDLGDRKADLDVAFAQQTCELAEPIAVQRGELYYISVLQVGGTAAAMHRKSLGYNMSDGLFPKYLGSTWATTGVSTLPSTIANADVLSGTRYWGALGTAAAPLTTGNVFLSDNFNRANSADLGPNWTVRSGNVGIISNKPSGALFTTGGVATHNTRLNSTSQQVGFAITGNPAPDIVGASLRGNGLGPCVELICTGTTGSTGVDPTGFVRIRTRTSYGGTATNRAFWDSGSGSPQIGSWTFEAIGNTYTGYKGGTLMVQWVDSGGAFTVAGNNTEVGILTNQDAFLVLDDWLARDL